MQMKMYKLYALLLWLLLLVASCSKNTGPDNPPPPDPKQEVTLEKAVFNDPAILAKGENANNIKTEILRYLSSAVKGSLVHINIYLVDDNDIINAIVNAHNYGVNVHILIDSSRATSQQQNKQAIEKLRGVLTGTSSLKVVKSDVIINPTSGSINHHKSMLFSEVALKEGIAKNVVFSTSQNFIKTGVRKVQDAVIFTDKELYNAFLSNWNAIADRASSGMKTFAYNVYNAADGKTTAIFFPRLINGQWDSKDDIVDILDKISDHKNATVQIGMSDWSDSRRPVVDKLAQLHEKGVKIEVIAKSGIGDFTRAQLQKLADKGAYIKILQMPSQNIHSKFMLINGTWDGKAQTVIINGTHNYTSNALRYNNEVILLLKNSPLFKEYQANYEKIKANF